MPGRSAASRKPSGGLRALSWRSPVSGLHAADAGHCPALDRSRSFMKTARQGAGKLRRGDDGRLLRDDDVEQHRMHLCVWVGAAIADDDQPIIQIAGVANGRLVWTPASTSVS